MSTPAQEQIMNDSISPAPVVVAVDGSNAAINAAEWAAKEALHHDVALRLVHVLHITGEAPATANSIDDEYAETCLRAACSAVRALGIPVQVDTALLRGDTVSTLIEESDGATLICLGSTGVGRLAAAVLGSTTAAVAERAHCPVAIIRRTQDLRPPEVGFIAVILDGLAGSAEAMRWAMEEARLRHAPVLALGIRPWRRLDVDYEQFDRQLDHWLHSYPDVTVEIATTRMSAMRYLNGFIGALQLVVVNSTNNTNQVMNLVGPHTFSILAHANCSVLIARCAENIADPGTSGTVLRAPHYR
jgi:nucleotide-binding universal stress UspA family protein